MTLRRRPGPPPSGAACRLPSWASALAVGGLLFLRAEASAQALAPGPGGATLQLQLPSPVVTAAVFAPAVIDLHLPEGAELWFQQVPTAQTGPRRQFVTPPLAPNQAYAYDVVARWYEGSVEMVWSESLTVRAGERLFVDVVERQRARRAAVRVEDLAREPGGSRPSPSPHMVIQEFPTGPIRAAAFDGERPLPRYMRITEFGRR